MEKKSKTQAPIHPDQSVSQAFAKILQHNFEHLVLWEAAARSWENIEGVHQTRVSLRRLRSAFTVFRPVIPKRATQYWADEMRWLGNQLGLARDLDVFLAEGLSSVSGKLELPGETKLQELAERWRASAYEQVAAMLDSERYSRFKREFVGWLKTETWRHVDLKPKQRSRLDGPVVQFARRVLDEQEKNVVEAGAQVDPNDPEAMHKLRIQCKKLRYAAEFFSPLFAEMAEFIGHLKRLQDLLGILNDVAVMHGLFKKILVSENDCEVLQYAAGIIGWRSCQAEQLRQDFTSRWQEFIHARGPWWKNAKVN